MAKCQHADAAGVKCTTTVGNDKNGKPFKFCSAHKPAAPSTTTKSPAVKVLAYDITKVGSNFQINIEVKTAITDSQVTMKKETAVIGYKTTHHISGITVFSRTEPVSEAGKNINYRFLTDKGEEDKCQIFLENEPVPTPLPKTTIEVLATEINKTVNGFEIKIEVKTSTPSVNVRAVKGLATVANFATDALRGEYTFTHVEPDTEAGKQINFRFIPQDGEENAYVIHLPSLPKPAEVPKASVSILASEVSKVAGGFEIKVEVKTNLPNMPVRMKQGMTLIQTHDTDANGEYIFIHTELIDEAGKTISLRFSSTDNQEVVATIDLPEAEKVKSPSNDPESLITYVGSDGAGSFRIFSRVLKEDGKALQNVPVRFQSGLTVMQANTNEHGFASWEYYNHRLLNPGEEVSVDCFVNGVKDNTKVKLRRPPTPQTPPNRWWKWNNGRAKFGLLMTAIMFVLALLVGYGRPFFSPITQPAEVTDQLSYENIQKLNAAKTNSAKEVTIPSNVEKKIVEDNAWTDTLKKSIWFLAFFFLLCAPPYFIFAYREEFGAAAREAFYAVLEKNYDRADDPLFEKLGRKLGTFSATRNKPRISVTESTTATEEATTATPQPKPARYGNSFWELLRSDLLSDFAIELAPKLLKKIMR